MTVRFAGPNQEFSDSTLKINRVSTNPINDEDTGFIHSIGM